MDGDEARRALGLTACATRHDIERAFRARANALHPDHGGDRRAFEWILAARHALVAAVVPPRLPAALGPRPHVDCYDSPRRALPTRRFADALAAATSSRLRSAPGYPGVVTAT